MLEGYKLYSIVYLEKGWSWIRDYIDEDTAFPSYSVTEITSENFDMFPLEDYLDAINSKLETWNYGDAMGFVDAIADRMKLVDIEEKVIKKMFYDWIKDKGLCLDFGH